MSHTDEPQWLRLPSGELPVILRQSCVLVSLPDLSVFLRRRGGSVEQFGVAKLHGIVYGLLRNGRMVSVEPWSVGGVFRVACSDVPRIMRCTRVTRARQIAKEIENALLDVKANLRHAPTPRAANSRVNLDDLMDALDVSDGDVEETARCLCTTVAEVHRRLKVHELFPVTRMWHAANKRLPRVPEPSLDTKRLRSLLRELGPWPQVLAPKLGLAVETLSVASREDPFVRFEFVRRSLIDAGGDFAAAADKLDIAPATLGRWVREFGMSEEEWAKESG